MNPACSKELNKKIDEGEIQFSKGPVKLVDGLWQLEIDGQQNVFLKFPDWERRCQFLTNLVSTFPNQEERILNVILKGSYLFINGKMTIEFLPC